MRNKYLLIYIAVASISLMILGVLSHQSHYFGIDLVVTRLLQEHGNRIIFELTKLISWPGYAPQFMATTGVVLVILILLRLRFEAMITLGTLLFSAGLGYLVKVLVDRPRPTPDLIKVNDYYLENGQHGFTAGHVFTYVALFGWLLYLSLLYLPRGSWVRRLAVGFNALVLLMIGFSRIYLGDHWMSDVIGGYLLGSICLAIGIICYHYLLKKLTREVKIINGSS